MIYRIAIYRNDNGKMVFDHYAKENELIMLKVSADGKVFKIIETKSSQRPDKMVIDWDVVSKGVYLILDWLDVSSTHEVEWGFVLEGNKYFQNDIIYNKHDKNKYLTIMWDADDCQFVIGESTDGYAGEMHLFNLPEWWTVIGTVHENPELLEVKE